VTHTYQVVDGVVRCDHRFSFPKSLPEVPRLGVQMTLAAGMEQLRWYGRGPFENYNDRKYAAHFGQYKSTVSEQYFPYILPQECGNKEEVRWLTLSDGSAATLRFTALGKAFGFSALHFRPHDLTRLTHTHQLRMRDDVTLLIDAKQRGLGTRSCGPDIIPSDQVNGGQYRLRYVISTEDVR